MCKNYKCGSGNIASYMWARAQGNGHWSDLNLRAHHMLLWDAGRLYVHVSICLQINYFRLALADLEGNWDIQNLPWVHMQILINLVFYLTFTYYRRIISKIITIEYKLINSTSLVWDICTRDMPQVSTYNTDTLSNSLLSFNLYILQVNIQMSLWFDSPVSRNGLLTVIYDLTPDPSFIKRWESPINHPLRAASVGEIN